MTGKDLRLLRQRYGLTQKELGNLLGLSTKSIVRREAAADRPIPYCEAVTALVVEYLVLRPRHRKKLEKPDAGEDVRQVCLAPLDNDPRVL